MFLLLPFSIPYPFNITHFLELMLHMSLIFFSYRTWTSCKFYDQMRCGLEKHQHKPFTSVAICKPQKYHQPLSFPLNLLDAPPCELLGDVFK